MSVSSIQSGYQLIQSSQALAEEAAQEIADTSARNDLEFNRVEPTESRKEPEIKEKPSVEESLTKLEQAKTYNQVGATMVQRSNDIIGTILDTHV